MNFSSHRALRNVPCALVLLFVSSTLGAQSAAPGPGHDSASATKPHYVGSESCKTCHLAQYIGWKKSRMANVLLDPKQHSEAVVGDFATPDPVRTFTLDDVAFTYGGRFKQRYFTKRGDGYF